MSNPVVRVQDLSFRYGEGDFRLEIPELEVGRAKPSGSKAFDRLDAPVELEGFVQDASRQG